MNTNPLRRFGLAASAVLLVSGAACAPDDPSDKPQAAAPSSSAGSSPAGSSPAGSSPAAAPSLPAGKRIGSAGSPCELPVSFEVAGKWEVAAIKPDPEGLLGDLLRKGSLTVMCEIKGKPAGYVAFIRVWTDPAAKGGARPALDSYLRTEDVRKPVWSELTLGGAPGVEVVYGSYSELREEVGTERAFGVQTPKGVVVVTLDGMEADAADVVAAYELARKTLAVNS